MQVSDLKILQNPQVRARVSAATLRALTDRANPAPRNTRFLSDEQFAQLHQLTEAILPQASAGTSVDLADTIDRRLQAGTNAGWRYASLPPDGEAYSRGLRVLFGMLQQTPAKTFTAMPPAAREGYLRCVANGEVDAYAGFPLATWLKAVRNDVVTAWIAHPDAMHAMNYFGFADGPTGNEGWVAIGPNSAEPFEHAGKHSAPTPDATAISGGLGDDSQDSPAAASTGNVDIDRNGGAR